MKRTSTLSYNTLLAGIISALLFFTSSPVNAQPHIIDSLLNLAKSDKEDSNKAIHLNKIGALYLHAGDVENSIKFADSAGRLAKETHTLWWEAQAYITLGYAYEEKGNSDTTIKYGLKALEVANKLGSKKIIANTYNILGSAYLDRADYPKALSYYLKASEMSESMQFKVGMAQAYGNIGIVYQKMRDTANTLLYFQKTLKLYQELGNKINILVTYLNIGTVYDTRKEYDKALDYFFMGYHLAQEINEGDVMGTLLQNIAEEYNQKGEQDTALNYFFKALSANHDHSLMNTASIKSNIGDIYLKQKKYKEAEQYILAALKIANTEKFLELEKNIYYYLSDLYSKTGQWQKAFENEGLLLAVNDSLTNQDKSRQIGELEAKAGFDKQLALQQAEENSAKAVAEANIKRQRIFIFLIAAIALIIALIAFTISRSLKIAKKEKLLVERQKVLLELKALRAQMNPHFIFNAINSIQLFILQNDSEAAHEHLASFSRLIRMVLENSRFETIPLSEEIKMLELYLGLEAMRFSSKFTYTITTAPSVEPENTLISPLIIQPYVENAIWHGLMHLEDRQGQISINFDRMNGNLKCAIDDNGIGRKRSMQLKEGSVHESMGLTITKERLDIIKMLYKTNMSVNFIDKINQDGGATGTCVELVMPYLAKNPVYA